MLFQWKKTFWDRVHAGKFISSFPTEYTRSTRSTFSIRAWPNYMLSVQYLVPKLRGHKTPMSITKLHNWQLNLKIKKNERVFSRTDYTFNRTIYQIFTYKYTQKHTNYRSPNYLFAIKRMVNMRNKLSRVVWSSNFF